MPPQTPNQSPEGSQTEGANERLPKPITPEAPAKAPEQAPAPQETARPSGDSANQNVGAPVAPVPAPVQPAADQPAPAAPVTDDTPAVADDVDLIEKEWVKKAKEVVEKTKDDPHEQNKQFSGVKSDYQKKRFGEEVKPADETG